MDNDDEHNQSRYNQLSSYLCNNTGMLFFSLAWQKKITFHEKRLRLHQNSLMFLNSLYFLCLLRVSVIDKTDNQNLETSSQH